MGNTVCLSEQSMEVNGEHLVKRLYAVSSGLGILFVVDTLTPGYEYTLVKRELVEEEDVILDLFTVSEETEQEEGILWQK